MGSPYTDNDRIDALDGLRALAILLVLLSNSILYIYLYVNTRVVVFGSTHLTWFLMNGWTGIDLFFALSGFLITRELLGLWSAPPGWHRALLRGYALRRFFRVAPAYYVVLLATLCAAFPAARNVYEWGWRVAAHLLFMQDYFEQMPMPQYASLAVVMQFYLLAPFLVLNLMRKTAGRRYVIIALLMAALFMLKLMTASFTPPVKNEALFFTVFRAPLHMSFDSLLAGMAACFLWHDARLRPVLETRFCTNLLFGAGLALFIFLTAFVEPHYLHYPLPVTLFAKSGYFSLIALACGAMLLGALGEGVAAQIFAAPALRVAAVMSYSLYLVNMLIAPVALKLALGAMPKLGSQTLLWSMEFVILAVLSIPPAAVLYAFVEKPLGDWARRASAPR